MDKCKIISEYEKKHNIPKEECLVEYVSQHEKYMPRIGISSTELEKRYYLAKRERIKEQEKNEIKYFYEMTTDFNIIDTSNYHKNNVVQMMRSFFLDSYKKKIIGIIYENEKIPLLSIMESQEYPKLEKLEFVSDVPSKENLMELQSEWLQLWYRYYQDSLKEELEEITQLSESLSAKQPKCNFAKEIKKMAEERKVFRDRRMEAFDFREADIAHAIFINCNLERANFSHVNLTNTIFVNCNTKDAVFYGASVYGCCFVDGPMEEVIDQYKHLIGGE